jgi:hypothetical protein
MEQIPEVVIPRSDAAMETDVEAPSSSDKLDVPVLPTWRLVCLCIR